MIGLLKARLKNKVMVLGVGNTLRGDDAAGPLLAQRLKDKVSFLVWDAGVAPENYLGKIIKEKPDNLIIIDAADFSGRPGEFKVFEADDIETTNFFVTHNASLSLAIKYLRDNIKIDIIILAVQPKATVFGSRISPEVETAISQLEKFFYETEKEKR